MKKLFFGMLAIVAMIATSCQQETDLGVNAGEAAAVSFNVGTPTRAYSDGQKAVNLQYHVYTENGELLANLSGIATLEGGSANVKLDLSTGDTYNVFFWADAAGYYSVDRDAKTVTVNYANAVSNDENRDAFYAYHKIENVQAGQVENVELKRPFAQLNIGTNDYEKMVNAGRKIEYVQVATTAYETFLFAENQVADEVDVTYTYATLPENEDFHVAGYKYMAMNYLLVGSTKSLVEVKVNFSTNADGTVYNNQLTVGSVPVQRNYRTNIYGSLLTNNVDVNVDIKPGFDNDDKYGVDLNGNTYAKVETAAEFASAFESGSEIDIVILEGDINLNDLLSRAADPSLTVASGKELTLDLNEKTLSATSTQTGKNYNMFDVRGVLTVKNGTISCEHVGENMGWNSSTNIFNVTAGGVLNLEGVTAKNLGGSDMGFVAHLNNWGEVTLNAENCTLESNYVPVRVFNSGYDMNNVTITNSTLKGGSAAFWVHNYTAADFGSAEKAESQKAYLNLNIYNQGNTFSPDLNGIRYGFTNSVRSDAYGITKVVSEDGTIVTLGSVIENGLIRRGVAGAEENTTIKKVVIEEGVGVLYDRTFRRYYALEEVVLPSTLTTIGAAGSGVFQSCTNLKSIVLPESVTVLGEGTFQECTSLESINIPAGVTRIEKNVFRNTGLTSVEFHAGVTYFGNYALRDCEELTEITINAPSFTVESDTFLNAAGPFPAYVIKVANAEMKAYLESRLSAHQKTFITVVSAEVTANNAVEFIEAVNNIVDGGTVIVGDNFDFTDEEGGRTNNGGWWDGLGYSGDKSFTIDLNGKTISNANGVLNDYLFWFKNDGEKASTITIKNGTLDAGTTAFCALCTASSGSQPLTIDLENVTLINNISNGSTIKARTALTTVNLKNGTKVIGKNSYLGIESWKATVNIYEGAEIYMNGTASYNGCLVGVGGNGVINVYGGYGKGVKGGFIAMTSGGTINVAGGEWIANTDGTVGNNSNLYVLTAQSNKYEAGFTGPSVINVTGGTLRGGMDAWVLNNLPEEKAELNISGGNYNVNPTHYLVDGKTATEADGIWTVE